ncbi:hypothetical protein BT93_G1795 [Corymbia citriodora subsp. variegata]|nr:hypothetical protein BT93_G1795 [Corymbia citriodora subsp. variegata]
MFPLPPVSPPVSRPPSHALTPPLSSSLSCLYLLRLYLGRRLTRLRRRSLVPSPACISSACISAAVSRAYAAAL